MWASVDPLANFNPFMDDEHYIDGQHNRGFYNHYNHNVKKISLFSSDNEKCDDDCSVRVSSDDESEVDDSDEDLIVDLNFESS